MSAREYEGVIGLEVHCQLRTAAKVFCGCSTAFGAPPNSHVCPVCLGLPGALPVLNLRVVTMSLMVAQALGCTIRPQSRFARKNYFYPDLPKGYQISQYDEPLAEGGKVSIVVDGQERAVGLVRIHIEEDTGKSFHVDGRDISRIDFNRCGVPLLEIVSQPEMHTPEEATAFLKELRAILLYLDVSDGNMEEGSFRCDANVSVRLKGEERLGTKVELKNVNSFRYVARALAYEMERQAGILRDGGRLVQETRLYNESLGITLPMRSKEEAHDYRYFPEPDLPTLEVSQAWVEEARGAMGELPAAKRRRYTQEWGLSAEDADNLTRGPDLARYFEGVVGLFGQPQRVARRIINEVLSFIKDLDRDIPSLRVSPQGLADLLGLVDQGIISDRMAKGVLEAMMETGRPARDIVEQRGLAQIQDEGVLRRVVQEVVEQSPKQREEYRAGKEKVFGFFVGQVMRATKGSADPKMVQQLLKEALGEAG